MGGLDRTDADGSEENENDYENENEWGDLHPFPANCLGMGGGFWDALVFIPNPRNYVPLGV